MWMSNIRLRNVTKRFGSTVTLHQVNLDIEDGEFVFVVGASGSRKAPCATTPSTCKNR